MVAVKGGAGFTGVAKGSAGSGGLANTIAVMLNTSTTVSNIASMRFFIRINPLS